MRARTTLTVLAALTVLVGCQPHYAGMEVRVRTSEAGTVTDHLVEITEGYGMLIEIRPISSNPYEDYEEFDRVELDSLDDTKLLAAPADKVNRFVLVGTGVGTTSIDVTIDGHRQDTLDAHIMAQEVPQ